MANPFNPTFGVEPPVLVGRDEEIAGFQDALDSGPGHPNRATVVTGPRGSGKTALLATYGQLATEHGWIVVPCMVRPGISKDLAENILPTAIAGNDSHSPGAVTGLNVSALGFGAGFNREPAAKPQIRPSVETQLNILLDIAESKGAGVLLTLDEIHRDAMRDLREITQTVQLAFGAKRQLAFVAAGLPYSVSSVLNDHVLTFLYRSVHYKLGWLSPVDTMQAIGQPFEESGRLISPEALQAAAASTRGHPYLIQMVGFQLWQMGDDGKELTIDQVQTAVEKTHRLTEVAVYGATLADLSAKDRQFLEAMALDEGPSAMGNVATRLGVSASYAGQYRRRLITAGVIEATAYGRVDFSMPGMRGYLRRQVENSEAGSWENFVAG